MDYPIRTVPFGGFDRQDVVRYLENFSRTVEEEKQALREENDRLSARTEELEGESASLRQQLEESRREAADLRAELDRESARRTELEALRGLKQENVRLRREAASLRRDAAAYARFRERVGSIECEARERADALEAGASEKMRRTMVQFQERYQELIRVIESTAGHVTGELRKVEVNLSQLPQAMDQADREFSELSSRISRGEYVPEDPFAEAASLSDGGAAADGAYLPDGGVDGPEPVLDPVDHTPDGGLGEIPPESVAAFAPEPTLNAVTDAREKNVVTTSEPVADAVPEPALEPAPDAGGKTAPDSMPDAGGEPTPEAVTETGEEPALEAVQDTAPEADSRTGSLRDAIQTAAAAKAPEHRTGSASTPVRPVRSPVQGRDSRNGLFGFGSRRR